MNRAKLIRSHFEAMRNLTWKETLEPNLEDLHASATETLKRREEWNLYAENRDWAWWQEEAKGYSDAELDAMRLSCLKNLEALEKPCRQEDSLAPTREELLRVLGLRSGKSEQQAVQLNRQDQPSR